MATIFGRSICVNKGLHFFFSISIVLNNQKDERNTIETVACVVVSCRSLSSSWPQKF